MSSSAVLSAEFTPIFSSYTADLFIFSFCHCCSISCTVLYFLSWQVQSGKPQRDFLFSIWLWQVTFDMDLLPLKLSGWLYKCGALSGEFSVFNLLSASFIDIGMITNFLYPCVWLCVDWRQLVAKTLKITLPQYFFQTWRTAAPAFHFFWYETFKILTYDERSL